MLDNDEKLEIQRKEIKRLWDAVNELREIIGNTPRTIAARDLTFGQVIAELSNVDSTLQFKRPFWVGRLGAVLNEYDESDRLELRVRWSDAKDCAYVPTNEDIFAKDWMVADD